MRGIRTSIRIRSGFTSGAMVTASSPLVATTTSCPANRRVKATKSRISRSSSAIKIFAIESSLLLVNRQSERKDTSITRYASTFHPNATFMHFHNLFNDGKTQSGPRRCQHQRVLAPVESLEHPALVFQRNANAIVSHIHLHFVTPVRRVYPYSDRPILGCVVIGIINQVAEDLTDTLDITINMWQPFGCIQGKCHRSIFFLRTP